MRILYAPATKGIRPPSGFHDYIYHPNLCQEKGESSGAAGRPVNSGLSMGDPLYLRQVVVGRNPGAESKTRAGFGSSKAS